MPYISECLFSCPTSGRKKPLVSPSGFAFVWLYISHIIIKSYNINKTLRNKENMYVDKYLSVIVDTRKYSFRTYYDLANARIYDFSTRLCVFGLPIYLKVIERLPVLDLIIIIKSEE